jgi:hypothetical protein
LLEWAKTGRNARKRRVKKTAKRRVEAESVDATLPLQMIAAMKRTAAAERLPKW